jgi:rhodanese-related sulfurtransferase
VDTKQRGSFEALHGVTRSRQFALLRKASLENFRSRFRINAAAQGTGNINQKKGFTMQSGLHRIHSPEQAKAYFEQKLAFTTGPVELSRWIKSREDNLVVIDVREEEDYRKGHIPGAVNIPREKWQNPQGLSRDKTNVVYCYTQQCHLAANACVQFASAGYPVMELEGGFETWKEHDLDIEEESPRRFQTSSQRASAR